MTSFVDLMRRGTILMIGGFLLMSGCLGASDELGDPGDGEGRGEADSMLAFELAGTDCIEGGGQSVVPRSIAGTVPFAIPPEPWVRADVLEDTGPQYVYSQGVTDPMHPMPTEGETWGHFHATLWCDSWTFNGEDKPGLVFGYVGAKVEDPSFSDGTPARSYLVTVVAVNDEEIQDALHAHGIHATDASATVEVEDGLFHTVLETGDHGTYDSRFLLKELGSTPDGPFRLWWQSENDDDTFSPVALDMTHTQGTHYGVEGQAVFGHTGTDMHGPQGGIYANSAGVLWMGHDRVITLGPRPEVEVDEMYHH